MRSWEASARGIAEQQKGKKKEDSNKGALETLQQINISQVIKAEPCWDSVISCVPVQSLEPKCWKGSNLPPQQREQNEERRKKKVYIEEGKGNHTNARFAGESEQP